jgi:hypothetical protein
MLNNQTAVMEAAELLQYMPRSAYHIIKIFPRNEQRKDSTFEGQISCISQAEIGLAIVKIHAESPSMLAAMRGCLHHWFVGGVC